MRQKESVIVRKMYGLRPLSTLVGIVEKTAVRAVRVKLGPKFVGGEESQNEEDHANR